ncbi:MAG: response regulator [Chloroflexota bacterium]
METTLNNVIVVSNDREDCHKICQTMSDAQLQAQALSSEQWPMSHHLIEQADGLILVHDSSTNDGLAIIEDLKHPEWNTTVAIVFLIKPDEQAVAFAALQLGVQIYLIKDEQDTYLRHLPIACEQAYAHWHEKQTYRRTEQALSQRAAQLDLINEIGRQIAAVRELDQVLTKTAELLRCKFDYHHVALFLLEKDHAVLKAMSCNYEASFFIGHTQNLSEGIIGWVSTNGMKLVANDIRKEPRFISLLNKEADTQSELCLPIRIGRETLGVLDIQSTALNDFDENTVVAMETLADAIAVAIENAHLYEAFKQELFERSQAERTLHAAYQRLTFYVENSPLIALEWDYEFQILHWPQEAEEFFGWQLDEVLGLKPTEWAFVHQEEQHLISQLVEALLSGEAEGNTAMLRHYTKGGDIVYCEWYNSAIYNEFNKLIAIVSFVLDVTEAQEAVVSLQQSEQRFRQVITSISDHVYVGKFSPDGQTYATEYTSPNVQNLTGYPIDKFVDFRFWQTLIHPDDLSNILPHDAPMGQDSEVEYRMHRANGEVIWVRDSRRIKVERDPSLQAEVKYVYGVVNNITQRKQVEFALEKERSLLTQRVEERTAKLWAANVALAKAAKLKDEFLASMSHELRTPLNAILGKSETLQEEMHGPLNAPQLRSLKIIEESGRHLLSLINEILDISKIEAGKLELEIRPAAVKWICDASLQLIREMAFKKQISVSFELDPSVKMVAADARRLKQIMVNLLSNAVKFTPEGGRIGLTVQGDQTNEIVHFTVWDSGIGISDEDMGRLFQPFVQLDSSLARQYEGTGLGLSLVYRMTKLHGGGVSVESEPDQGSRFTVSLPWPPEDQTESRASALKPEQPKLDPPSRRPNISNGHTPPSVLVVEDNEHNIDTLQEYLSHYGYRMITAYDGSEALDLVSEEIPDVILMDIQIPGMDGLEATKQMRADKTLNTVPIIALTGLAMPGDKERCIAAGADDYLSKPFSLKKLIAVIEQHLS